MKPDIRFYIEASNPRTLSSNIFIYKIEDDAQYIAEINWKLLEDAKETPVTLKFPRDDGENMMQHIMDELWNQGVRPSDIGTAGHLAATQEHLKDMRTLAFHVIGVSSGDK